MVALSGDAVARVLVRRLARPSGRRGGPLGGCGGHRPIKVGVWSPCRDAITVAQAKDFVEAMPSLLDTPVSQGGTTVSGGQRQRLSIARALVRKPHILLFDDSFSALDTATDARLRAALGKAVADATVIVVAQRVSSIIDADLILVMEDGRIIDRGTHAQLLKSSPTYQEIVSTQLRAEEAA